MRDLPEPPRITGCPGPLRPFSGWSVASLALLTLALASLLLLYQLGPSGYVAGVGNRILILLELGACLLAAWASTLVGAITGCVGVRRSGSLMGSAWAAVALNGILCIAGIPLWAMLRFRTGFFDGL
jgi:hypothetical protein